MTDEQKELFEKDPLIKLLMEKCNGWCLTGGVIIDILEGRKPKDYDFRTLYDTELEKLNFKFLFETKTAITYLIEEKYTIQVLKTLAMDFDFKISTTELKCNYKKELFWSVDKISFDNKILIPQPNSFEHKKNALNSLKRIPHWRAKGYSIPDETYMSLLNVLAKNNNTNS